MKITSFKQAPNHMRRPGARLIHEADNWYITPDHSVPAHIAEYVKTHPLVRGSKDGLFPGMDQTWRMGE